MLRASHRLSVRQFEEIFEKGRVVHSPFFTLRHILPSASGAPAAVSGRTPAKVAAVAPSKTAKTASRRTYLRRKIYEMVKPLYPRIKKGALVAVFIKPTDLDHKTLAAELEALFAKAGLLE